MTSKIPITSPQQLRQMSMDELSQLAETIRQEMIDVVSQNGGHLASNLGLAELTVALHYVFNFAEDRLLWDVGHQCYAHKILTGRADRFHTLRQKDGLSGFPAPNESEYDLFHTGHAGTAISTAAGLAMADQSLGRTNKTVAMVGDASIVNGLSLEGLNNVALLKRQFLIVLNDNSMAIDRTRGALAEALEHLRLNSRYAELKQSTENVLKHIPLGSNIAEALKGVRHQIKTTLHGPKMFETLGFNYFGPIDGHDIPSMIHVLQRVAEFDRPVVLHVHTQKGRGCAYAVENPCRFHSPSAHHVEGEKVVFDTKAHPSWTSVFADTLIEKARADERIVAITAAMPDGTGLAKFREVFPERTFDVGISESHAVAMAAGMVKAGLKPVVAIYSTFMQRAFDQVFHECSLQKLPVIFCMDRAGLVGSDGAVHHGSMDVATMRVLPGMELIAPADKAELNTALDFALTTDSPVAIRYPRDEVAYTIPGDCPPFVRGKCRILREGTDGTLLAYGAMIEPAMAAAEQLADQGVEVAVLNARFAKPLDEQELLTRLKTGRPMVVIEDHSIIGGLGSAVLELAADHRISGENVRRLGIPDAFIAHASRQYQLEQVGLTSTAIAAAMQEMISL